MIFVGSTLSKQKFRVWKNTLGAQENKMEHVEGFSVVSAKSMPGFDTNEQNHNSNKLFTPALG
ncbi:MAG TPA: hypothetical protein VFI73_09340 [Candidatus Nitrosopolaris sp.]|nr:hypothetical protein [Candidatus Nitrosopolaris sp.]